MIRIVGIGLRGNSEITSSTLAEPAAGDRHRARAAPATGPGTASPSARPTRSRIVAGKSRRLTVSRTAPVARRSAGNDDQERHADLRSVQALAMVEEIVLPHPFTVIGGHDHQRAIEHAATAVTLRISSPSRSSR